MRTKPTTNFFEPTADGQLYFQQTGIIEQNFEPTGAETEDGRKYYRAVIARHNPAEMEGMPYFVDVETLKVDSFKKNPVILFNHNSWEEPIGRCVQMELKHVNGLSQLEGTFFFSSVPTATNIETLWNEGCLNAVSIGVFTNEKDVIYDEDVEKYRLTNSHMREFSVVSLPADPSARRIDNSSAGKDSLFAMGRFNFNLKAHRQAEKKMYRDGLLKTWQMPHNSSIQKGADQITLDSLLRSLDDLKQRFDKHFSSKENNIASPSPMEKLLGGK